MSDQPTGQDTIMSENKPGKQPIQEATSASNQQAQQDTSHATHEHKGHGTRGPACPLINLNENLEGQFKRTYHEMLDFIEKEEPEEAEKVAHILLSWGNVPVLYRAYAHMVLAHGLYDCLFHAEKAVEEAEWGLKKYGDDKGVGSMLLATTKRILEEVKARPVEEDTDNEEEQEVEAQGQEDAAGESGQEQGQRSPAGEQLQAGQDDDEMLFDQFEAERGDDGMLLDQPYPGDIMDPSATVSQPPEGVTEDTTEDATVSADVGLTSDPNVGSTSDAPSRTTSGNTTVPSRTTSGNTTVPSRTASNTTTGDMERKKREKRDRSESSNDEDKPPQKKVNIGETHSDGDK